MQSACKHGVVLLFLVLAINASAINFTLTVNTQGSGTVTRNPNNSSYPLGATVTVTATPATNWHFDHWSGNVTGTLNPTNIRMTSNVVMTANFRSRLNAKCDAID